MQETLPKIDVCRAAAVAAAHDHDDQKMFISLAFDRISINKVSAARQRHYRN